MGTTNDDENDTLEMSISLEWVISPDKMHLSK
jgi:hypothetical protein